ncbi:putative protein kinase A anchor protein, nuclear localization signal [Helianthus annuus]|nr:putative protein kinase A anchor protein, nuclear localization signal [Helianthus annuus]
MVGGNNIRKPASMQASSSEASQAGHGGAALGTELVEPNNSMMVSSTGKHSISMEVGSYLSRFLQRKWSSIESETGAQLVYPSPTNEYSLTIGGTSECVGRALEKIRPLIDEGVNSPRFLHTHFISLPLATHPRLVDKLINFQNSVLGTNDPNPSELGIDESIFIKLQTLHLTVLMLKLWNKERVEAAVKIFKGIEAEVMDALGGQPVSIKLKGLNCLKGSFEKAHILYLPVEVVDGDERLLRACEIITDAFTKGGLVLKGDAKYKLKLHVTVMNTIQRPRRYPGDQAAPFDARGIINQYGSEEWGEYAIPEVHLSQRFKYDDNGYYHCCASIPLNP